MSSNTSRVIPYFGAGILPFCVKDDSGNGSPHFLLLQETRVDNSTNELYTNAWIDLGGKAEYHDTTPYFTALREFHEESHNMYKDHTDAILKQLTATPRPYPMFRLPGRKDYYLYCVKVPYMEPTTPNLQWVTLQDLLSIHGDMMLNNQVAPRLLQILNLPSVKQQLLMLG